ncbi:hypothetical protein L3X38_015909 [Prunus dulcis]|uniref:Uncharacterized protein n=1 Tax=Prunus dulcis TaxID=3755 RepID=A0AAD4W4Z6_PRUDU|nr:hypothetical protein L3X38_015909 [Prunus dulcis]
MDFNHPAQQLMSKIILTKLKRYVYLLLLLRSEDPRRMEKLVKEMQRKRKAPEEVGNGENGGGAEEDQ